MSDESWEEQFKQFLRKKGEDFRRTGEDVKAEAQKLFDAAMDPEKKQRVQARLKELTVWARKKAQDVAGVVEEAANKAETAFHRAAGKVTEATERVTGKRTSSSSAAARAPAETTTPARSPAGNQAAAAKEGSKAKVKAAKPKRKSAGKRKR